MKSALRLPKKHEKEEFLQQSGIKFNYKFNIGKPKPT